MPLLVSPTTGRKFGYLKDWVDHRDLGPSSSYIPFTTAKGVPAQDLESFCGPVEDQAQEGSCTGHAGEGMREFLARKWTPAISAPILSPAKFYWLCRQMDAFWSANNRWPNDQAELLAAAKASPVTTDEGSTGRTVCRTLNLFGMCTRDEDPYVAGDFATPPTDAQIAAAVQWKAGAYHRLGIVQDMKNCLVSNYVFCIGFNVYESFESIGSDGLWTPRKSEDVLGGHEVLCIGYDDSVNGGSFKVRNSWGSGWGASGNFWMRYQDAADPDILMDAWMQHLGKAW